MAKQMTDGDLISRLGAKAQVKFWSIAMKTRPVKLKREIVMKKEGKKKKRPQ
jgi:hypothetical protein